MGPLTWVRLTGCVLKVGLTGGIGAGKTAVASRLAELGAIVIDADRLAREVVEPGTPGLAEIVEQFGSGVLNPDGALDRPAIGRAVFGDEAARRRLEAIIHPRVRTRTAELISAAPPQAIVVNDVPLLVETGLAPTYHLVLVVHVDEATRVDRLVRLRGMAPDEAYGRVRAQASDADRLAAADVVLANDGTLDELVALVDRVWRDRLVPFEENLRLRRAVWPDPAVVVPYDPSWPAQYARLAARISHAGGPAVRNLDHVGATAVPGLAARDVIGVQLGVADLDAADAVADALADAGLPLESRGPEERLHGSADPGRAVDLRVRVVGSTPWRQAMLVRDVLQPDG